jgi:hypothetical protein
MDVQQTPGGATAIRLRRRALVAGLVLIAGMASGAVPASADDAPPDAAAVPAAEPAPVQTPDQTLGASVVGDVWFDRDGDGVRGQDEWPVPRLLVTLAPVGGVAALPLMHLDDEAGRGAVQYVLTRTTVTGADGSYRFDDVAPGSYAVTTAMRAAGFSYASDTDGGDDWVVHVDATPGGVSVAGFAGRASGELTGSVTDVGRAVPGATIGCGWAGFDELLQTGDDIDFRAQSGGDGSFRLTGLPDGTYRCVGEDPGSGAVAAPLDVHLAGGGAPPVELVLPGAAPVRALEAAPSAVLPATGLSLLGVVNLGLALVALGMAAIAGSRWHRRISR